MPTKCCPAELIQTVPASMRRIARSATFRSRVQTAAVSPYSVPLASAIASSSERQRSAQTTGPKTSSRAILMPGSTESNNVGSTQ